MKIVVVALMMVAFMAVVQSTTIVVENYCREAINLYLVNGATAGNKENDQKAYNQGNIAGGGGKKSYTFTSANREFVFKAGANGKTLAEFLINGWGGNDYYDVSRVVGYDYPILIVPPTTTNPNCVIGKCLNNNCGPPDAYGVWNDDAATHACPTGKNFRVLFCAQ